MSTQPGGEVIEEGGLRGESVWDWEEAAVPGAIERVLVEASIVASEGGAAARRAAGVDMVDLEAELSGSRKKIAWETRRCRIT